MTSSQEIPWFDDFLGVAYRFYDLRMNVVPLFSERKDAANIWNETVNWWSDHSIKIRFVEINDDYWFVMGSDSQRPESNRSFFKVLSKSEHFERFKKGHDGEAYLRLGVYTKKSKKDSSGDAICECGHEKDAHEESDKSDDCYYDDCECIKFDSFQLNLLKKKKTITDIKFLQEDEIKDDPLTWNCLYLNKYKKTERP